MIQETYEQKINRLLIQYIGTDNVISLDYKNAHGIMTEKNNHEKKIQEFINAKLP